MKGFENWYFEATKEPVVVGYVVNYWDAHGYKRTTKPFKSFHEAKIEQKKMWEENRLASVSVVYSDKTSRMIGGLDGPLKWHYNRVGQIVDDSTIDSSGRGKTNHAYLAKDDPSLKLFVTLNSLEQDLTIQNMPMQTGYELPKEFWSHVKAAIDQSMKEESMTYIAQLYDFIKERYDENHEAVETCLRIIRYSLNKFEFKLD